MRDLAGELAIAATTICRWPRPARIDAGEIVGVNSQMASEQADAKQRIRDLEEELVATKLTATKLTASMLKDDGIRPKGGSLSSEP